MTTAPQYGSIPTSSPPRPRRRSRSDSIMDQVLDTMLDSLHFEETNEELPSVAPPHTPEKLSTVPLAVLIFYGVSGGPFGVEASVRSGGHLFALLGFLVMPLVWSVPEALMTAELGSAFPEASGGVAWVEEAFGAQAGWLSGYFGWVSGATDNAIYPVLFLDYLLQVVGDGEDTMNPLWRFLLLSSMSIVLAYINWLGLPVVGRMSMTICWIAMSPFIILTIVGAFKVHPERWFQGPTDSMEEILDATDDDGIAGGFFPNLAFGGVLWRPFLNNLFWNLNSFDAGASFAGDIDGDPGVVLPRAMFGAVLMVFVCYFFPLLVAIGASEAEQHEWVDGFLARIASEVVGPWLGGWTVFAAGISNIAMFQAELSADAFQLMGMADRGHLPKIFSTRSPQGTPTWGIVVGTLVIVSMSVSNLDQLIEMLNFNYAIALLMEYSAFVHLRLRRPELHRPYRIPLNTLGCCLLFLPTFLVTLLLLSLATFRTYIFILCANLVGFLLYYAWQQDLMRRQSELCQSVCVKYSPVQTREPSAE